ncbi:MAG TPA: RDD family protein [Rudaea sp.]|nr:RDD family protein [Rudaea sp.]
MSDHVTATPAPLRLRLAAAVYDLLPLIGLWFVAAVLALAVTGGALDTHTFAGKCIVQGFALALSVAYFVVSWTRGGQTIAMRAWKLRLVDASGAPLRWSQALLRFVVALVSLAALGAGFWWALFDPQRRTWQDIAARTRVLHLPKT